MDKKLENFMGEINDIAMQAMKVRRMRPTTNADFIWYLLRPIRMKQISKLNYTATGIEGEVEWQGAKYKVSVETIRGEDV